ncbi:MAG: hypothetical protein M3442_03210 [Chloroflexota bacterium]|nr:hypothetical protein [Chloroflexota bacterium]
MPDLTLLFTAGRLLLIGYATLATILVTACLALQVVTAFDRWMAARGARPSRSLFVRLDSQIEAP